MRYKAIAAALGAASLLAMGIAAAEESVKSNYSIDGAGTTVTHGPYQTPWPGTRLRRPSRQHPPADSRARADCVAVQKGLVKFGGGLWRRHRDGI